MAGVIWGISRTPQTNNKREIVHSDTGVGGRGEGNNGAVLHREKDGKAG